MSKEESTMPEAINIAAEICLDDDDLLENIKRCSGRTGRVSIGSSYEFLKIVKSTVDKYKGNSKVVGLKGQKMFQLAMSLFAACTLYRSCYFEVADDIFELDEYFNTLSDMFVSFSKWINYEFGMDLLKAFLTEVGSKCAAEDSEGENLVDACIRSKVPSIVIILYCSMPHDLYDCVKIFEDIDVISHLVDLVKYGSMRNRGAFEVQIMHDLACTMYGTENAEHALLSSVSKSCNVYDNVIDVSSLSVLLSTLSSINLISDRLPIRSVISASLSLTQAYSNDPMPQALKVKFVHFLKLVFKDFNNASIACLLDEINNRGSLNETLGLIVFFSNLEEALPGILDIQRPPKYSTLRLEIVDKLLGIYRASRALSFSSDEVILDFSAKFACLFDLALPYYPSEESEQDFKVLFDTAKQSNKLTAILTSWTEQRKKDHCLVSETNRPNGCTLKNVLTKCQNSYTERSNYGNSNSNSIDD